MKVLILLCFAIFACHQAAAVSKAEVLSLLQTNYGLDDVLTFLKNLRGNQADDIETLDQEAAQNNAQLSSEVDRTTDLLNQKNAACTNIANILQQGEDQAKKLNDNIQGAQSVIDGNGDKAKSAADQRCAANLLFISELGDKEEAIEFLTFLRGKVADPSFAASLNSQEGSFVQMKSALATNQDNEILSLIAKHHLLALIQTNQDASSYEGEADLSNTLNAKVRTSDEVGTDFQDNTKGALEVQGVGDDSLSTDQVVAQLLGFVDSLINNLKTGITSLQDVETQAVQAFIDYRRKLSDQNTVLQAAIDQFNTALTNLQVINTNNKQASEQCQQEVPPIQEEVQQAQQSLDGYKAATAAKRQSYVETLALLDNVVQVYTDEVVNLATDEQKARADDYLDNQKFDNSVTVAAAAQAGN